MKVFITGGSGLIGRRLVKRLISLGHAAVVLTRDAAAARPSVPPEAEIVEGDPRTEGPWLRALESCDAVVNLAGENLFARRWSARQKERLRSSRIDSTRTIARALAAMKGGPRVLVSGSAVGYYGFGDATPLDESAAKGEDFLAELCADWEKAAQQAEANDSGVRVVLLRTGVVLDPDGGALPQMAFPFRFFAGGPVGSGRQWVSWIHRDDMTELIIHALTHDDVRGPLNATAPEPLTNREVASALGRALGRPAIVPTPAFAVRLMLGEVACVVIEGQRALPKKAQQTGFTFSFPNLEDALADLYPRG